MKIKIKTLGCKVNQYESQAIAEKFSSFGHTITDKHPDLYLINTCTVTKTADKKSRKMILQAKRENPKAKIIACGCLAQTDKDSLEEMKVDWIIPQEAKPSLVEDVLGIKKPASVSTGIWDAHIRTYPRKRAFVKIQDGCDLFCSFCKIPYIRPKPTSRNQKQIITEIKKLSKNHKEIVLCGVNISLYGRDLPSKTKLSELVASILKIKSLGRIRLSSLQPLYLDKGLISLLAHPKLCPHFHLAFQYGQDSLLKAMNKKENVRLYRQKVKQIKEINPQAALSCDIIIGFPDETDTTFDKTLAFLKEVRPMRMHIFRFSPRDKTILAKKPALKADILQKRYRTLKKLAEELSFEYYSSFINKELEMIAEEKKGGFITGYTQNYIKVHLKKEAKLGSLLKVKITKINKDNKVFAQKI